MFWYTFDLFISVWITATGDMLRLLWLIKHLIAFVSNESAVWADVIFITFLLMTLWMSLKKLTCLIWGICILTEEFNFRILLTCVFPSHEGKNCCYFTSLCIYCSRRNKEDTMLTGVFNKDQQAICEWIKSNGSSLKPNLKHSGYVNRD